jgi:NADP-dependent 3-hydroxy acid dehydrogenase YdfG
MLINVAARAGVNVYEDYVAYSMSKAAVFSLSHGLRAQLASRGVRVSTLVPGPTATPMQFAHAPWHALLRPQTVAAAVMWIVDQPDGVAVEELHIAPFAAGEVGVDDGPQSRTWPR